MPSEEMKKRTETLKMLRVKLEKDLERIEQDLEETQKHLSEEANNEDRSAEVAALAIDRDMDLSTEESIRKLIDRIDVAIDAIREGTYGICESCGKPIPDGRLKIVPYATRCVECQRQQEK